MTRMPPATAAVALPPEDCAAEVLDVMPTVMDAMRGALRRHVGEQLSVPQFRCLNFIHREPGSSVGAVAAFLGVTMPTASAMVDRLVRAGAVAPRTAVSDRRRSELQVTPTGQAQLRQVWQGAHGEFTRLLAGCTADELQALQAGLSTLRRVFQSG
jgi:DNA-binding MarR family transcriptional regulator